MPRMPPPAMRFIIGSTRRHLARRSAPAATDAGGRVRSRRPADLSASSDLGRRLDADSRPVLDRWRAAHRDEPTWCWCLPTGSPRWRSSDMRCRIDELVPGLGDLRLGPMVVARQARVGAR